MTQHFFVEGGVFASKKDAWTASLFLISTNKILQIT